MVWKNAWVFGFMARLSKGSCFLRFSGLGDYDSEGEGDFCWYLLSIDYVLSFGFESLGRFIGGIVVHEVFRWCCTLLA